MSSPSSHPLLRLVDANKNSLKCALVKYIDVTVENQFGQLRNRIVEIIESGETVLGDVNASNQTTVQISSSSAPLVNHITTSALVKQEYLGINEGHNPQAPIGQFDNVKEEYDDDDSEDEGEYMSDCDECEDCVKGICGLVGENDNAHNRELKNVDMQINKRQGAQPNGSVTSGSNLTVIPDAIKDPNQTAANTNDNSTASTPSSVFRSNDQSDQITLPPTNTASLKRDLIPDVIGDSNQSAHNANDLSSINESEHQICSVRKSTRNVPTNQNDENGQSAQPVIELDHQSINILSTSGLRSSGRNRIQMKMFGDVVQLSDEVKSDKRKRRTQSSKAVKKVKTQEVDEIDQEEKDDEEVEVEEETKLQIVTLKLNCTEPGCMRILDSIEMWKEHLSSVHGQIAYKHLEDNVRLNQHGQTEYACSQCNAMVNSQRSLIKHWRYYHKAGKFGCSVCAFVANFRGEVHNHQQKNHRSGKIPCTHPGCNQALKNNSDLKKHERIHSGERPFSCIWDKCQLTFNRFEAAIRHVRTQHFRLPPTVKEQQELNIIDERNPKEYIRVSRG